MNTTPSLKTSRIVDVLDLKHRDCAGPEHSFHSVVTDSRRVNKGCLFVALKGEAVDGHNYIEQALDSGASGILCQRSFQLAGIGSPIGNHKDYWIGHVDDTLEAYRRLAKEWRQLFSIPIIVVAGSAGKTTTKELLAALFSGKWQSVHKTEKSQNGYAGIPATLFELRAAHSVSVIEVGIDEIGAMEKHIDIVRPDTAILTAIGPEHLEKLMDVPTVAREEGIVFQATAELNGTLVINLDDPWIRPHFEQSYAGGKKICFTLDRETEPSAQILRGHLSSDHRQLSVEGLNLKPFALSLPAPGQHNARNLLGAIAIAAHHGLTPEEMERGLKNFKPLEGRSVIQELPNNIFIICDYYNAQPASMAVAFDLLSETARRNAKNSKLPGKTWACLGDMLELGENEEQFHRELAPRIIENRIQNILLYGPRMKVLESELRKHHFSGELKHFLSQSELSGALTNQVRPGDTILIKGSRGMRMEEIHKYLAESFRPR